MKRISLFVALIVCLIHIPAFSNPEHKSSDIISENRLIVGCPTESCPSGALFDGKISNTGTLSGGPYPITGVELMIYYEPSMQIKDLEIARGEIVSQSDGTIGITIGDMSPNEEVAFNFWALPGSSDNYVEMQILQNEFNPGNESTFSCDLEYMECADLQLTKSTIHSVYSIGEEFLFDFEIKNLGPDAAQNVQLYDDFFSPFALIDFPSFCSLNSDNNALTCDLGTIESGETSIFSVRTLVEFEYENTNVAIVTSDTHDPVEANNQSSAMVSIIGNTADVEVSLESNKPAVKQGNQINYTIKVKNNGPVDASNVKVVNKLPTYIDNLNSDVQVLDVSIAPTGCSLVNGTITCDIPVLKAGEELSFHYVGFPLAEKDLFNFVEVTSESPEDPFLGNNFYILNVHVFGDYSSNGGNDNESYASDPVSVASGEYFFSEFEDIIHFGVMEMVFDRYYASRLHLRNYKSGAMGKNWSHNYDWRLVNAEDGYIEIYNYKGKVFAFEAEGIGWQSINHGNSYQLVTDNDEYYLGDIENRTIYTFNSIGQLVRIQALNGLGVDLGYENGNLSRISDSHGREMILTYNSMGLISSITNGIQTASYEYQDSLLIKANLGNGKSITYTYETNLTSNGLITARSDYDSNTPLISQEFGINGEVVKQVDILNNGFVFEYDSLQTRFISPGNRVMTYDLNPMGSVKAITNANGATTTIDTDSSGQGRLTEDVLGNGFDQIKNPLTSLTEEWRAFDYNVQIQYKDIVVKGLVFKLPSVVTYPESKEKHFEYDDFGNLVKYATSGGDEYTYTYNDDNLVLDVMFNGVAFISYNYNDKSLINSITDFEGNETLFTYDDLGRLTEIHKGGELYKRYEYNGSHLPTTIEEGGQAFTITYTSFDQVQEIKYDNELLVEYFYNPLRQITGWRNSNAKEVQLTYDGVGNIASFTDKNGDVVLLQYDLNNNITQAEFNGSVFTFQYNEIDQLIGYSLPDGKEVNLILAKDGSIKEFTIDGVKAGGYEYNDLGQISGFILPGEKGVQISRGANGQVENILLKEGIEASLESFGLDNYTKIVDPNGGEWTTNYFSNLLPQMEENPDGETISYTYDHLNRLVTLEGQEKKQEIIYNSLSLPVEFKFDDGSGYSFEYDQFLRLIKSKNFNIMYDQEGNIRESNGMSISRDSEGKITQIIYDENFSVEYLYNDKNWLEKVSDNKGNEVLVDYFANGQIKSLSRSNGISTEYIYNGFNQVINITESGTNEILVSEIVYNDGGLVSGITRSQATYPDFLDNTMELAYSPGHQLQSISYDPNGNALSSIIADFSWNDAGDLVEIRKEDQVYNYSYDVYGNRIQKTDAGSGILTNYINNYALGISQPSIIEEGELKTYVVYLPDGSLLYTSSEDEPRFYHFDYRGNTQFISNTQGDLVASYSYTPYGNTFQVEGSVDQPFAFQGKYGCLWEREFDLVQMHRRTYDLKSRRFLSRDQDFERMNPKTMNPYVYTPQDPINYMDPLGNNPTAVQKEDLKLDPNGSAGFGLFLSAAFSTGLSIKPELSKLPNFSGGIVSGLYDLIAGSPGAPESFSKSGKLLESAKQMAGTGRAAGQLGYESIKTAQFQQAIDHGQKSSAWEGRGKAFNAAGNVLTIINVGIVLNNTRKHANEAADRNTERVNTLASTLSVQMNNLLDLLKKGKISPQEFRRSSRKLLANYNFSFESSEDTFNADLLYEGVEGLSKSLEALLPNPSNFSIFDGISGQFGVTSNTFRQ